MILNIEMKKLFKKHILKTLISLVVITIAIILYFKHRLYHYDLSKHCDKCSQLFENYKDDIEIILYVDSLKEIKSTHNRSNTHQNSLIQNKYKQSVNNHNETLKNETKIYSIYIEPKDHNHLYSHTKIRNFKQNSLINKCKYRNCFINENPVTKASSNAIILKNSKLTQLTIDLINENSYKVQDFTKIFDNSKLLENRTRSQIWIYWKDDDKQVNRLLDSLYFNWTISYKKESEINQCVFGCIIKKTNTQQANNDTFNQQVLNEYKTRAANAIYFLNDCQLLYSQMFAMNLSVYNSYTTNNTNKLIFMSPCYKDFERQLKSKLKEKDLLVKQSIFNQTACDSRCELDILKSNMFVLVFDNDINNNKSCSNYIQKKFWYYLSLNLIPIVMTPNKSFYEINAPSDSYIHAQDYNYDPVLLSKYMHSVSTDFELYLKHMKWKYEYDIVFEDRQIEETIMCDICTKLNEESSEIYYNSISKFFNNDCS